jgi:hypothetical protein
VTVEGVDTTWSSASTPLSARGTPEPAEAAASARGSPVCRAVVSPPESRAVGSCAYRHRLPGTRATEDAASCVRLRRRRGRARAEQRSSRCRAQSRRVQPARAAGRVNGRQPAFRTPCRRSAPPRSSGSQPRRRAPIGGSSCTSRRSGSELRPLARALPGGYTTFVLTVDVLVAGARHRDVRNGLAFPPSLTARTLLAPVSKPRWLFDSLTTEPLASESSRRSSTEVASSHESVFGKSGFGGGGS